MPRINYESKENMRKSIRDMVGERVKRDEEAVKNYASAGKADRMNK